MPQLTATALARRLGFSRATVAGWRRRFADAPPGNDVDQWRAFILERGLGEAPNRVGKPTDVRLAATEALLAAEAALHRAQVIVERADPERGRRMLAARRKIADAMGAAWTVAEGV